MFAVLIVERKGRFFGIFLKKSGYLEKKCRYLKKKMVNLLKQAGDFRWYLWGCLHDTGATSILARAHSGSLLWLCIRLHDTKGKCHAGASHTGASSPRFLCLSEIFTPAWNSFQCHVNGVWLFVSYSLKFHQFYGTIRLAPQQTRLYVNTVELFISPRNETRAIIM